MNKMYMNLSTKRQNIKIDKPTNNLALNTKSMPLNTKSMPLTKRSLKHFLARIKGVSKDCTACGK